MKRTLTVTLVLVLALLLAVGSVSAQRRTFVAPLSGAQEVPPVDTQARGQAVFRLSKEGDALHFRLTVANLDNVTAAHIHLAPAQVNGPAAVWLFSGPAIEGRTSGLLAEGVITDASLFGPLAGQTLADLVDHLAAGNAYVNVHTSQFPAGEIRGQIR